MDLCCVECGKGADGRAVGWRGYLAEPEDDEESEEIVFFCPACAAREFRTGS